MNNLGKMTKSKAMQLISSIITSEECDKFSFINSSTSKEFHISIMVDDPQSYIDEKGNEWVRKVKE